MNEPSAKYISEWNEIFQKPLKFIKCENCHEIVFSETCSKCRKDPLKWGQSNDCTPEELPEIFKNFPSQAVQCLRLVICLVII